MQSLHTTGPSFKVLYGARTYIVRPIYHEVQFSTLVIMFTNISRSPPSRMLGSIPTAVGDATTIFASTTRSETEPHFSQSSNSHFLPEAEVVSPSLFPPLVSGSTPTNRLLSRELHLPIHQLSRASTSDPGVSSVGSSARLDQIWTGNIFELVGDKSNVMYPLQDFYSQRRTIAEMALALPSDNLIRR